MSVSAALPTPRSSDATDRVVVAFDGDRLVASGSFADVVDSLRAAQAGRGQGTILIFDARTSEQLEVDPRPATVRIPSSGAAGAMSPPSEVETQRGPGRPRLGVVAREVTLLPRHWEWLASQPGGASAALRRLVERARTESTERDRVREAQESAYRFMSATLGNQPHFEETLRALFAGDADRFSLLTDAWPRDLRDHARHLAAGAFASPSAPSSP